MRLEHAYHIEGIPHKEPLKSYAEHFRNMVGNLNFEFDSCVYDGIKNMEANKQIMKPYLLLHRK